MSDFKVISDFKPKGDQPGAIKSLVKNLNSGLLNQTLLGVTGSGKTFTIAKVIEKTQRPAIIMAPNKTLAAQLYGEFKDFFPENRVEYFISYYDYYQPEAYVPSSDTYIAKDANINEHIEQMRLSATKALIEAKDTIVVASVSAIYGLGAPESYLKMVLNLSRGEVFSQRDILRQLAKMQYSRNDLDFNRANFRVRGNSIDIFPAEAEKEAIRIELDEDKVGSISFFDPLTGALIKEVPRVSIFPKTHYVTSKNVIDKAINNIKKELKTRLVELKSQNKLLEVQRLEDLGLEMITHKDLKNYNNCKVLIRAHGEPPETYKIALENNIQLLDASCPVVLKLQHQIKEGYKLASQIDGQIIVYGKAGHAEVIGLLGQIG